MSLFGEDVQDIWHHAGSIFVCLFAFWVRSFPEKGQRESWGHCLYVRQSIVSFGEVCLVRCGGNERGKQIDDSCYSDHKQGRRNKRFNTCY